MSPCNLGIASQSTCFPRVSGDEPADAEALYRELQGCVPSAQRIGVVKAYRGGKRIFLR